MSAIHNKINHHLLNKEFLNFSQVWGRYFFISYGRMLFLSMQVLITKLQADAGEITSAQLSPQIHKTKDHNPDSLHFIYPGWYYECYSQSGLSTIGMDFSYFWGFGNPRSHKSFFRSLLWRTSLMKAHTIKPHLLRTLLWRLRFQCMNCPWEQKWSVNSTISQRLNVGLSPKHNHMFVE